jgi:hypothetical protein
MKEGKQETTEPAADKKTESTEKQVDKNADNPWRVTMSPEEVKKYNEEHGVKDIPTTRPEGGRTPGEDAWDRRFGDKHYLYQD